MNETAKLFYEIGEPYAAGLFEEPDKGYFYRHTIAYARYFANLRPAEYKAGERLYPRQNRFYDYQNCAVNPQYCNTYEVNWELLEKKSPKACELMQEFVKISHNPPGWTHGVPNYPRIIKEGLASYRERVKKISDDEMRKSLLELLDAMESYIKNSISYLKSAGAPAELISAMEKVPFQPASSYYEGLVAWNLIFYFDGCDNLGRLDEGLAELYRGEDYTEILGELFDNVDATDRWTCTVGPNYNAITRQALKAARNRRRPLVELMITDEMPEDLWELTAENYRGGTTHPSLYNERGIFKMLKAKFPQIPDAELKTFSGGGCTETNLQGLTRAGGVDADFQLLLSFENYMHAHLCEAGSFEEFYEGFCLKLEKEIDAFLDGIVEAYEYRAKYLPNPPRTIFIDDCIEKEKDFNAGGARYTWIQSAHSGLINVIDSLLAVRELIFTKKRFTAEEFLKKLTAEDPVFYQILASCPCYGVGNEEADALAADFAGQVYMVYHNKPPKSFIEAYLLTEHQFQRYEYDGTLVGATPDGRRKGEALGDSIAAIRGKAKEGPTAMLRSAARLPQHLAKGISVLNLTISKNFSIEQLKGLIKGYFAMGGIQAQVTCTSVEELRDALANPEKHRDLIVRVGGYSEYFINLTPGLQKAVVERNVHEM